ncbi:hypothetical protein BESB_052020 [Besnoitia besnoiti]|uniref:Uncharacterized protein n=1 Tax=Besnoitia besnoiti TaxID=94643 RepID=A0A2A9MH07_BESBE|nr:hypothetical protein BESB_052020 [Besnoitia besnoiti]PFH35551.1 hypothetical protein BESB_052020 [Besnoitia besnoiti]
MHGHLDNGVAARRTVFFKGFTRTGRNAPSSLLQLQSNSDDDDDDADDKKGDDGDEKHGRGDHDDEDAHKKKDNDPHEHKEGIDPVDAKFMDRLSPDDKEALIHGTIDPAVHFPLLLHMSWKELLRAVKYLRKATDFLDTVKGHMDAIPRDEAKVPSVSAAVKIEVSGKEISIADINSKVREVLTGAQSIEGFLSSARSQVNARLAKVLPQGGAPPAVAPHALAAGGVGGAANH